MPNLRMLVLIGLMSTACGVESNYTLQLRPVVPLNQDPFGESPRVWLGVHESTGDSTWSDLDVLTSGSVKETGFAPLAGDRVGIALGGDSSPAEAPESVFAYGETAPLNLSVGGEEIELGVLIAESDGVGALTTLDEQAYGAALAALDDGRVYAFGGIRIEGGACETTIQRMDSLNEGEWTFNTVGASLPQGLCYAVATVVEVSGRQHILLTGGETSYNGYNQRSAAAILFDPATEEIVDTQDGTYTRARHTVAPLPDGRLLLVGTHQIGSVPPSAASWEVLDPEDLSFGAYGTASVAPWDFMAAPIPGGVALCGGGRWVGSTVTPLSACIVLQGDGGETPLPSLPQRTRAGAMTRLSDGRLLVVGGITSESNAGPAASATDAAFILDPNADDPRWEQIGRMTVPRAYPVLVADNFGGAIVLGGAEAAWAFGTAVERPADCGERLVLTGEEPTFERLATCGEGGTGVQPSVTVHPSFGALMLEGRNGGGDGGQAIGFWSRGP